MSKPTTLAPPSIIAPSTRPISGVQVTLGLPAKGGVLKVSSSSATTTAGDDSGECRSPKARQRSTVRISIDQPRNPSKAGEAATRAAQSAMRAPTAVARRRTGSMDGPAGCRYSKRNRRLAIGAGPDLALASMRNGTL